MRIIEVSATNMSELTTKTFKYCLSKKGDELKNIQEVEGTGSNVFRLNSHRLQEKRKLINAILAKLPEEVNKGLPFRKLFFTKDGEQWTNMDSVCEELVVMAIGLDLMEYCCSRALWKVFPNQLPYVMTKTA